MWSERCYCQPPLTHERATILDHYFDDIVTRPIEDYQEYDGRPFMDYLDALVETPTARSDAT